MTAKQYIKEALFKLASSFPFVTIKYAFNSIAETHIVELTPVKDYYSNTELEQAWYIIAGAFMESYPLENIAFISDDSILKIAEPEIQFNLIHEATVDWFEMLSEVANMDMENVIIPDHVQVFSPIEFPKVEMFYNERIEYGKSSLKEDAFTCLDTTILPQSSFQVQIQYGENTFAMAA